MASTTLITPKHTWYGLPFLWVPFRRSGAPLRRNPSPAGVEPNLSPTSLNGAPKRVAMSKYLLGCVRVDTSKSQDNGMTQLFTRFTPVSLPGGVHSILRKKKLSFNSLTTKFSKKKIAKTRKTFAFHSIEKREFDVTTSEEGHSAETRIQSMYVPAWWQDHPKAMRSCPRP